MSLRSLLSSPKPKLGTFLVEFATPGIGHILAHAGCDFVLADLEHSGFGMDTTRSLLRYLEAAGLPAIVGLPSGDPLQVSRVLDIGAPGVMSPMVETAAEAAAAVARIRHAPRGVRAVSSGVGHDKWQLRSVRATVGRSDPVYFTKIETARGVENAAAIATTDGVDGLWVGHGDLSVSLGLAGQYDHPTFLVAENRIVAAAAAAGKPIGRLVADAAEGQALLVRGFSFIGVSGDAWLLQSALTEAFAALRN